VVSRLKVVADMAKQFRRAIQQTLPNLAAGEVIMVGKAQAVVVDSGRDTLTIRIAGQNRTYTLNDLPLGLAIYLGERSLNEKDPKTPLFKGAYVFIDKRSDEAQLQKAQEWWEEAQLNGVDASAILPVFNDNYDLAFEPTGE